ncbi:MAG: mechanosensitive ion channel [Planctomycetota bacterium]
MQAHERSSWDRAACGWDTQPSSGQAPAAAPSAQASPSQDAQPPPSKADLETQSSLAAAYAQVDELRQIQVKVRSGVVQLSGQAASTKALEDAEKIAQRVPTVLFIDNLVSVQGNPAAPSAAESARNVASAQDERTAERLRAIFSRVSELGQVKIEVHAGVVRLSGTVVSSQARAKAEQVAKAGEGVVFVENAIEETQGIRDRLMPSLNKMLDNVRNFVGGLPLFVIALAITIGFWYVSRLTARIRFDRVVHHRLLQDLLERIARSVIVIVGIFIGLQVLDATALVGAVLGAAGVVGLALGFAFRDIIENYLASVILSIRRPFLPHDLVRINDLEGTVVRLASNDTVLMTADGNLLRIPNAVVFKGVITNFSQNALRRFDFVVAVAERDVARAQERGRQQIERIDGVVSEPAPFTRIDEIADAKVKLHFFAWVERERVDFDKVKSEAIRLVNLALKDGATAAQATPKDVSRDGGVEAQVEKDRRESKEKDLLQRS